MRAWMMLAGVVALGTHATGAYLPAVGPAPLRFRATAPRVALLPVKPPPSDRSPPALAGATTNASPRDATTAATLAALETNAAPFIPIASPLAQDPDAALPLAPSPPEQTASSPLPAVEALTPQMMMHFFQTDGTPGLPSRGVSMPLVFEPPVPSHPRVPSKATGAAPPAQ